MNVAVFCWRNTRLYNLTECSSRYKSESNGCVLITKPHWKQPPPPLSNEPIVGWICCAVLPNTAYTNTQTHIQWTWFFVASSTTIGDPILSAVTCYFFFLYSWFDVFMFRNNSANATWISNFDHSHLVWLKIKQTHTHTQIRTFPFDCHNIEANQNHFLRPIVEVHCSLVLQLSFSLHFAFQ